MREFVSPVASMCDRLLILLGSCFANSVSPKLQASIIYEDTALEIWNDLKNRFAQNNGPRVFNLQKDIAEFHQGKMFVIDFFTQCDSLQHIPPSSFADYLINHKFNTTFPPFSATTSASKVLKPGPNRTVRSGKPRTAHLCGSFSFKNPSTGKKQGLCESRSKLMVLRTVIRPLLTVPYFPLNLNLKIKK